MSTDENRVDAQGRAFAGSRLQVQIYTIRRARDLSQIVANHVAELEGTDIEWRTPREQNQFAEPMDEAFLSALGLDVLAARLRAFWPRGGPRWDALGVAMKDGAFHGVILVDGKSHPAEMIGPGCRATAEASRTLIETSLEKAREWFGASAGADWLGKYYEYANRLAHVYFLREFAGVPAWLVNLCFVGDTTTRPTSVDEWGVELVLFKHQLGFETGRIPYVVDVLLSARSRAELLGVPAG